MTEEKHDDGGNEVEAPDLDEMLAEIGEVERSRQIRTAAIGAAVIVLVGAVFVWMAFRTDDLFRPNIDVEAGEQELLEDTGDPVCRGIISEVENIEDRYRDWEFEFEDYLWGNDEEQLEELEQVAIDFRGDFADLKTNIDDAVFREEEAPDHPPVPEQVHEWFDNMDNEFRIIEEMANKRLRKLRDEEVADRSGLWENPRRLRDTVLMTVDENFEEFRVWVIRGGHPCGPPPDGVDPWEPDDPSEIEGVEPGY